MRQFGATKTLKRIAESEETRLALIEALSNRRILPRSPFAGDAIGPMIVLGPTHDFYSAQMGRLLKESVLRELEARNNKRDLEYIRELFETEEQTRQRLLMEDAVKELGGDPTSPVNEVSTVMALPWAENGGEQIYLFTGDVGREGLHDVLTRYREHLGNIRWLDVPHHGSRRSMTQQMIDFLAPQTAFVSCDGTVKHPSRKLVNALKKHGKVYSTHYSVRSKSWLLHQCGIVPKLSTSPAVTLYDKAK
jgi:hypothetical protein